MKNAATLILTVAAAAATATGGCKKDSGDKCDCLPGWTCDPVYNICLPPNTDADADAGDVPVEAPDTEGEGLPPDGEGVVPDDQDTEGNGDGDAGGDTEEEEFVCDKPCEEHTECDDGNPCTEDWCAPVTKCCTYFTEGLNYTNCGDELFCNGADYCLDGTCTHEDVECGGGDSLCSDMACEEGPLPGEGSCTATPKADGTGCDDGLYCTGPDNECQDGNCQYSYPCTDIPANPCMMNNCYEDTPHCRQESKLDGEPCPDSDMCNGSEYCEDGACTKVVPPCIDGDPCTIDECIPATSDCKVPPDVIANCTDCTGDAFCDDANPCTTDYCRDVLAVKSCDHIFIPRCVP